MNQFKTGRNDPCPCGSGKKYKKCCLGNENPASHLNANLREALAGRDFDSLEDAQSFVNQFMQQQNHSLVEEFHGLSPEQMHHFLYMPFESPDLVSFPVNFSEPLNNPMFLIFSRMVEAIGEEGIKTTAKGNLPAKLCKEIALELVATSKHDLRKHLRVNKQDDFFELCIVVEIAKMAGLIKRYKGTFQLTKTCTRLLKANQSNELYSLLLTNYCQEYNWGYNDQFPDLGIIQHSFLFTVYLLHKYGSEWRENSFYNDCFYEAFPAAVNEIIPTPYMTPEDTLRYCYSLRALERFAEFVGLVELKPYDERNPWNFGRCLVKKTPLLDKAVVFNQSIR
jgi:hypothetical protein